MTAQPVVTPHVPTPTPILDRVQPLPTPKKRTWWSALAGGLVAGVSVPLLVFPHYSSGSLLHVKTFLLNINPLVFFPLVILMYYAAVLVHESGHLLAGLIVGFRVDHMRVGPLLFRPPLRVSVQRHNLYGFAAHAQVVPFGSEGLRYKMLVFALGGVSANLLSGALAVWLYWQMEQAVFGYYAVLSLLMGVFNLVPFTQRVAISDGKRAWMLLFDRPEGDRWLAMIRLSTDMLQGTLPEKCAPSWSVRLQLLSITHLTRSRLMSWLIRWLTFRVTMMRLPAAWRFVWRISQLPVQRSVRRSRFKLQSFRRASVKTSCCPMIG